MINNDLIPIIEGYVNWNNQVVNGGTGAKKYYRYGKLVIVTLEFTPLSGKIANNNIICGNLPIPRDSVFVISSAGRQMSLTTGGNLVWYYPSNTNDLSRVDICFAYIAQ